MPDEARYKGLVEREAKHWGQVKPNPENPQIWEDERLFEIFFGKEYRHLIERAVASGPRVLELGCGEGNLSIDLARRGLHVDAIDLSPERIERARHKACSAGLDPLPQFNVGDLNTLALQRETYNCVVAHDSLHHIFRLDYLLDEVHRALRPGGRIVVMDYVGMGMVRKAGAAFLTAVLPTFQPYRSKLKLAGRLRAFLATEEQKRRAVASGSTNSLHEDSPFEEISQQSLVTLIRGRFNTVEEFSFNPFLYYLAPKIRLPRAFRYRFAERLRTWDDAIVGIRLAGGAHVFIEAVKP